MRFLFCSAQLPGHLDWGGYLKTAIELRSRGHEVLWVSGQEVQPILARTDVPLRVVDETGWRWPPPPPLQPDPHIDPAEFHRQKAERALDQWLDTARVEQATSALLDVARGFQPDALVGENFMSAAALAADVLDVPFVVAGWPAFQANVTAKTQVIAALGRQRLETLLTRFRITGRNWTQTGPPALLSPHCHLTYWSDHWYTGMTLLPQTRHVGGQAHEPPTLAPDDPASTLLNHEAIADDVWVFITLGTSFGNDPNFFIAASHAVTQVGAVPIIALGQQLPTTTRDTLRKRLARGSVVLPSINFDAVLPAVSAAIHHGGAGTTHALVTHGVPQIIVPRAADQIHQAHGVTRSGVGVGIQPRNVTIDGLSQMVEEMVTEESVYQRNAARLQKEFAELGGVSRAADLLENVVDNV